MAENEELNEQQNNEQQQENNQPDIGEGRVPDSLNDTLDTFIKEADVTRAPPLNKVKEETTEQPKLDAQGKPVKDEQQQVDPNKQGARQPEQIQQVPTAAKKYGNLFHQDSKGNVYNAKGELFAASGGASRIFAKFWPYLERVETEAAGYKSRVENYERATQAAKDAGLSLDEQSASLSLMVAYKKDKKAAINFLLQQAEASGTDVSDIRQGGGGLTEAALRTSVKEMLQEALVPFAPFIQQNEQQAQVQAAREEAASQFNEFMETRPDAALHTGAIALVMEANPQMDMNTAYFELKTHALQAGLDWTKPLAPQYAALKERGTNRSTPNGGRSQVLPDLNGRANGNGHAEHGSREVANADTSWDNIINDAVASVNAPRQ